MVKSVNKFILESPLNLQKKAKIDFKQYKDQSSRIYLDKLRQIRIKRDKQKKAKQILALPNNHFTICQIAQQQNKDYFELSKKLKQFKNQLIKLQTNPSLFSTLKIKKIQKRVHKNQALFKSTNKDIQKKQSLQKSFKDSCLINKYQLQNPNFQKFKEFQGGNFLFQIPKQFIQKKNNSRNSRRLSLDVQQQKDNLNLPQEFKEMSFCIQSRSSKMGQNDNLSIRLLKDSQDYQFDKIQIKKNFTLNQKQNLYSNESFNCQFFPQFQQKSAQTGQQTGANDQKKLNEIYLQKIQLKNCSRQNAFSYFDQWSYFNQINFNQLYQQFLHD